MRHNHAIKHLVPIAIIGFFMVIQTPAFEMPIISTLERIANDIRIRLTLKQEPDTRIVIVDIDEMSLSQQGQWPWPRPTIAKLIDQLTLHYQVKTIGFDMVFAEAEPDPVASTLIELGKGALSKNAEFQQVANDYLAQPSPDDVFSNALENGVTIVGYIFSQSEAVHTNFLSNELAEIPEDIASRLAIVKPEGYTANIPKLEFSAHGSGFFDNPLVDDDGVFRRVPLIQLHQNKLYPSLALSVSRAALGDLPFDIQLEEVDEYLSFETFQLGSLLIPLDLEGAIQVPYRGFAGSFKYVSAGSVLNGSIDKAELENKIVLIGTSAAGLLDLRSTPVGKNYPGVEVHANIISGILDQRIPARPAWAISIDLMITLISGLVIWLLLRQLSPIWSIVSTAIVVGSVTAVNVYTWNAAFILNIVPPLACIAALFIWQVTTGFLVESRNKLRIARQFGQYIPPSLVEEMVDNPEDLSLKGENRNLSVLFSDVRGFTTLSEGLEPDQLTQMMNDLLTPLTRVIHENRGTIDKYMGDAIMAFWGAPLKAEDHATRAVKAALDLQAQAKIMRKEFVSKGLPPLEIGVGINTGDMNVGNMGSEFRMAYTVLGDAVNLGSRIEGLTRVYGVDTLISETTQAAVPNLISQIIDLVQVKGKTEPVMIYEPIGFREDLTEEQIQSTEFVKQFHTTYCKQQWDSALQMLDQLEQSAYFANPTFIEIYRERIEMNRNLALPEDWCGLQIHTTK